MSMNPEDNDANNRTTPARSKSALWQFLYVLVKWKWFLLVSFTSIMIIVTVILLLIPRRYKAEASVLSPERSGLLSSLTGASSLIQSISPMLSRAGFSSSSPTFRYLAILNSRTVMDSVIKKFDLIKVYRIKSYPMETAVKELRSNSDFEFDQNDALNITVIDKKADRAADMANYFVTLLDKIYTKVSVEEARNNRIFMQKQYEKNLADIRRAEDSLETFQKRYRVYDVPQQAKAAITAGADLEAQRIAAEVQLGVLRKQFGAESPEVKLKKLQVDELQKKLDEMQTGSGTDFAKSGNFFPAFDKVPELGISYLRRLRDYEIQTKLLEYTLPMYEQAKVEEQKDTPAVIVLDRALPPEKATVPKRLFIEVIFAFLFLSILIYIVHVFERVRSQSDGLNPLELKLRSYADATARRFRVKEEAS